MMSIEWYRPKLFIRDQMTLSVLYYPTGNNFLSLSKQLCDRLGPYVRIGIDRDKNCIVLKRAEPEDKMAFEIKTYRQSSSGMITDRRLLNMLYNYGFMGKYWVAYNEKEDLFETGERISDE